MDKNTYTLIGRFECCGKTMVTVIIEKTTCIMLENWNIKELLKLRGNLERKIIKYHS